MVWLLFRRTEPKQQTYLLESFNFKNSEFMILLRLDMNFASFICHTCINTYLKNFYLAIDYAKLINHYL